MSIALYGQAASSGSQKSAPVHETASVCEVAKAGSTYSGHVLQLTGIVAGHDPAHLLLTSSDCILGVRLAFATDVQAHDDVRVLFAAVQRNAKVGASGGTDSGISGTFEGTFTYSQDAGGGVLEVEGIDRLSFPKRQVS